MFDYTASTVVENFSRLYAICSVHYHWSPHGEVEFQTTT